MGKWTTSAVVLQHSYTSLAPLESELFWFYAWWAWFCVKTSLVDSLAVALSSSKEPKPA
ncbi:hypothetical protein AND4_07354 [Vibrio sp. AND4]|nr:hypothetical protein AND4_07354 [Vibrio sp. AND4]